MNTYGRVEDYLHYFLTFLLDGKQWLVTLANWFAAREITPVSIG
jgi:hypothetical protein